MKFLILCILIGAAAAKYSARYDNIQLDTILRNSRLLNMYVGCLMEKPKAICNNEGNYLKEQLPEAIETDCKLCTEKQKVGAFKAIDYLIRHQPATWKEIQMKFDPTDNFRVKNQVLLDYCRLHENNFNVQEFLNLYRQHVH